MSANSTSAKVIKTVCKVFVGAIKFKERRHMFRLELLTRLRHLSVFIQLPFSCQTFRNCGSVGLHVCMFKTPPTSFRPPLRSLLPIFLASTKPGRYLPNKQSITVSAAN